MQQIVSQTMNVLNYAGSIEFITFTWKLIAAIIMILLFLFFSLQKYIHISLSNWNIFFVCIFRHKKVLILTILLFYYFLILNFSFFWRKNTENSCINNFLKQKHNDNIQIDFCCRLCSYLFIFLSSFSL